MKNSKKLVNLISLVVLVATNILSPLSYVTAEDDLDIGDAASYGAEQDSGGDSSAEASNGDQISPTPLYQEGQESPEGGDEGSSLIKEGDHEVVEDLDVDVADAYSDSDEGDVETTPQPSAAPLTGSETPEDDLPLCEERGTACGGGVDSGTGEFSAIDMLKDAIEALSGEILTGNIELLTGENLTGEVLTGDVQELTGQIQELTGAALELATARETLNSDLIEKSEKYNSVTVNVKAQPGTFPENTKLHIEAIKGNALEEVRQQISDEPTNNVDEDAEIVAFDITFTYELSDGTEIEVQPKDGESVQVTFDYSKNKELKAADKDDSQQIEIYHINDKDENGEKVAEGEEVVEKIEINQEKSEEVDNALVIDAESFSTYAVVVNNSNPAIEATIGDTLYHTTLDGNNNTMNDFYYRTLTVGDITIMDRNLGATESWDRSSSYDASSAVVGYHYQWGNNYGFDPNATPSTSATQVTRGTADGYSNSTFITTNPWNSAASIYDVWTQGPCPAGWHVPSNIEWQTLYDTIGAGSDGTNMGKLLQMPFAGYRIYFNANVSDVGSYGYYWSSTPLNANEAYYLYFYSSFIYPQYIRSRASGFAVRCFRNSPITITFNLNGGYWTEEGSTSTSNKTQTYYGGEGSLTDRKTPSKVDGTCDGKKCMFDGWYTDQAGTTRWAGDISSSITVYAKWLPFEDWTIPGTDYVIMDRNLGATSAYGECTTSNTATCGYHFQWGNNYGFKHNGSTAVFPNGEASSQTKATDVSGVAPSTYYGPTFIYGSSNYTWNADENLNLRGGQGDTDTAEGDATSDADRQGPCPGGYHVPSTKEWKAIYDALGLTSSTDGVNQLKTKLNLPFAGFRNYNNANVYYVGSYGLYWSSTPGDANYAYYLSFSSSGIYPQDSSNRARGFAVRCLKNSPQIFTITLNANGGELEGESSLTTDNEGKVTLPRATREPNENGERVFEGWFADEGMSEKIGNPGDEITLTEDMTVYAHWAQTITIWDPANPGSGFTIMDRNLGAITTGTWVNASTDSYGFHYQWGNNYGFDPNIDPSELPTSSVKVNVDGLTSYYSGVFITTNKSNENDKRHDTWMETNNNNLWNGDKIQGPCPEGWHIPSHDELNNLLIYRAKSNNVTWTTPDNSVKINSGHLKISNDLYIPYAGARNYDGSFLNRGNLGIFWSYSINGSNGLPYDFFTSNIDGTYVRNNDGRIRGFSVRCFRDEYVAPTQITYNPNGGAFSGKAVGETTVVTYTKNASGTYEPDINIQFPNKAMEGEAGYMFAGWYTDTTYTTEWTGYVNGSTQSQTVYAKWLVYNNKTVDLGEIGSFDIMDRNMGAEAVSDGLYNNKTANQLGYYYQWGNNYGFKNSGSVPYSVTTQIDITGKGYGPGNYYSSATFVKRTSSPYRWDTDTSSTTYTKYGNLNLWGGENTSNPDSWRQGPCPENYHVPDTLEWKAAYELFKSWANTTAGQAYCATFTDDNTTYRPKCFASKLALPFAGSRNLSDSNVYSQGTYGRYWSSSPLPSSANDSYYLRFYSSDVDPQFSSYRANGFSVRCFKNSSTQALTFNTNGGTVDTNITQTVRRWENGTALPTPTNPDSHKEFKGWYTTSDFSGSAVTTNALSTDDSEGTITLYAKWESNCPEGEEYVESKGKCIPSRAIIRDSVSGEIIQINEQEWDDLELYFLQSDGTIVKHFTIMDRNMGATEPYNQQYVRDATKINTASFGYQYQWGNNYGFEPCINDPLTNNTCKTIPNAGTPDASTIAQSIWSAYSPSKYARNTWSTSSNWMAGATSSDNIWGGGGDTVSSNHDGTLIGNNNDWSILSGRQGPCPDNYYIPSAKDWNTLKNAWGNATPSASNGTQFASDLLLPPAGVRLSSKLGYVQGLNGYYWSSTSYSNFYASNFLFNASSIEPNDNSSFRSYGLSVRCARSSPNTSTFTLYANGGTKAVVAFTGTVGDGKFTALGTPTRGSDEFDGWYTANEGGEKLGVGSGVVSDIYARWSCDSGYIDLGDGNGCVKSEATLLPGTGFNAVIKQLANPGNAYVSDYWFMDSNVTGLIRAQTLTTEYVTGIISTEDSIPVYVWYNNGVVYYYSDAEKIYLSEDSSHMFHSFKKLVDISGITNWDTSKVMNMERMFYDMESLVNVSNISGWDTSKVTDMNGMFSNCYDLKDISGIENWDTSKVTDMNGMFSNCDSLEMVDLTNRNVGNVTDMSYMFLGCEKLKIVNLSGWNATNLDSAEGMFKWCEDLEMADLSNWNAENLTTTEEMFEECYNLETLYLNGWNTRNLITTRYMFQECYRLKTLDLSSWNINNVTDMLGMFRKCYELETLDLSSWNTNNLVDMEDIFDECTSLKTIYASSGFVVNGDYYMFDTENLVGGNGTRFDWNFDDGTYAKIDNENQTGYFTDPSHFAIRFRNLSGDEIATQWISTGGTATGLVKNYASFSYYTDSGATTPYDFTKKLYAYSEVYADMSCDDGYTEVDGECVQQYTVEFEAYINGGLVNMSGNLVSSGTIKVASGTEINLSDYIAVNDPTGVMGTGWIFDGWGTIPERQFKITSPTLVITGDITLHALFYKIYESYFELQDINAGTLSSNTGYCTGYNGETSCDLIIPTFTENDGYIFDGFSNSQGSTGTIDIYTIGNTYYTVTHETTPISVTFNVNGNSGTTETRECYKYNGSDICLIKSPDITPAIGFTKIGWSTDAGTHTNEWNVNTLSGVSANSTYYAQSKKDKVTLNISYGTGVGVSSISKISDSCDLAEVWNGISQATSCTVTAPDITLKSGYGTGVWAKDTNPSVIKNPGDDIELTSNDSYTASAIATVYPILYHENGGTLVGQKTSYTVEEDFTLVTPNRDSYVFEGWTGSNGDNPQKTVTVNSGTVTGPLNYYANWTPITYTIAFNGNAVNVEGTQSSMDATYDSGDTAPESNFTRPGYTFTSWNTQSDGNGINYDTGSELKNLTNTSGDVVTLYAIWQANTDTPYTVHYYLENIDDENYTFDSTDGKAGTTDDEISIDTLKKEFTGAHFEKAAVVVSNQGPEYGATTTVDNITISGDGNTEVYLFYKRNTHTVTAIAGEGVGSVSGAGTYKYGQTVTLTPGNINSCYTANSKTFIMPDNDVQETLNGVIKKFTVTLNKDSHISSVQGNGEYNCGVEVNVSATPNVGYEFVRWEKNSTQVSAQSSYTFTITESVVLNAVSKAQNGITYTVRHWIRDIGANTYAKYSEESKSGETDSPITLENEKISVPCGTYAEGKENGTVKTTTIIKGDGSTVIDLYYSRNSYTVTISKDSGILSVSNSASHECGAGVTITATPKTGYSFNRYSSTDVDSSTNNPYTFTMPDKAVSIQAQSNANTYTVNFNANGGTGTMSQQTFTYDISQQLSDNLFTRTGYIFTGWSIDSGATVPTYTNKQSVDNLATTGSITLYAIWTTKGTSTKYTVRHIKQGLSTPTDDVVETQELYAETNSVQTPAVNTYSGFNSPSVGNITVSANGNASIDYVYTRKNITLTLDKDNGTQNSTITGKYGANVQKPTSNPQKTGYTFTGWSPNIPDTFPAISGTHVAQYTLDTYTITYNLNGGINHIDNPTTYTYLSGDITLKAPTRDGYVFSGWMGTDVNSVTKTVTISTHSEGNRSYTAVWGEDRNHDGIDDDSELKYTVTINYVYSRGGTAAGAYTTGNQLSGFTYNVDSPIITNYHADKTNVSGTITGNVEVTVTYTPDHDTNNNGIADEEESITPTPAPSGGSSSSGGGGGGKKPTDGDSHGSASDENSEDSNKIGENPVDTSEEGKGGENLNEDSKGNFTTDIGVGKTSNSSSQGQTINNYSNGSYTREQVDAYNFAKSNGITTMPTIEQAKMNTSLTRIQMAKMLSNFAINVMKQEPDPEKGIVKFNDVTNKMDKQYNNAVTLAYQLGIMGINMKNNNFRPNDGVTRAEFATALSRLLYKTDEGKYKSTSKYYEPHIAKLYQEGIINNTNPELKEKRGYVMIMLMRSAK